MKDLRHATMPNKRWYSMESARRQQIKNETFLQQLHSSTLKGTQTVRNRFLAVGLYSRRLMVCVTLISYQHREWTTKHANWTKNNRRSILFPEQSHFMLILKVDTILSGGHVSRETILRLCRKKPHWAVAE